MPRDGYRSVTLSEPAYREMERLVQENPELFDSASQFVKMAINDLILKVRAGRRESRAGSPGR